MNEFTRYLAKSFLLEESYKKGILTEDLKNHEMDENEALNLFVKSYLLENQKIDKSTIEEEAKLKEKIKDMETIISKYIGSGFAALSGIATATTTPVNPNFSRIQNLTLLTLATILSVAITKFQWWVISKIIKYVMYKTKSQCLAKFPQKDKNYYKCQSLATDKIIKALKQNMSKCSKTSDPIKCRNSIMKEIRYYTKMKERYDNHLKV